VKMPALQADPAKEGGSARMVYAFVDKGSPIVMGFAGGCSVILGIVELVGDVVVRASFVSSALANARLEKPCVARSVSIHQTIPVIVGDAIVHAKPVKRVRMVSVSVPLDWSCVVVRV